MNSVDEDLPTVVDPAFARAVIEKTVIDTSAGRPVYVVSLSNGTFIRLSASAYGLLSQIASGASFEEIARVVHRDGDCVPTVAMVTDAYGRLVERIRSIEVKRNELTGAFWFKRQLISAQIVQRIANVLACAYRPVLALPLFVLVIVGGLLAASRGTHVEMASFWPAYVLFTVSLAAHELGHASACAHYGRKPSDIGFLVYVVYPAFYSDVSEAWTLTRWQRVVVDVGGSYFQIIVGAIYSIGYSLTRWEPLHFSVLMIIGSCLFSLNPLLKFDGYWVVSDALGVANLGKQPARIFKFVMARLLGHRIEALPWSPAVTVILVAYTLASATFWSWFLGMMLSSFSPHALRAMETLRQLGHALLADTDLPNFSLFLQAATAIYVLLLPSLILWRLLQRLGDVVCKMWQRRFPIAEIG